MAIALILFSMTALANVVTTLSSQPTIVPTTTVNSPVDTMAADDPNAKHDKRSLNAFPFEPKYLGTEKMTLVVYPNGTVGGVKTLKSELGVLHFITACQSPTIAPTLAKERSSQYGKVSIKANSSGLYICMNRTGDVYGSKNCTTECEFKQKVRQNYDQYYSLQYKGRKPDPNNIMKSPGRGKKGSKRWYLAIHKTGKMIPGWKAKKNRATSHLIQRPIRDKGYKDDRYSSVSTNKPHVDSEVMDRNGSVTVSEPSSHNIDKDESRHFKSPKEHPRRHGRKEKKRSRNCDPKVKKTPDPLNLFRLNNAPGRGCNRRREPSKKGRSLSPFSSSDDNTRRSTSDPSQRRTAKINLFSFPIR